MRVGGGLVLVNGEGRSGVLVLCMAGEIAVSAARSGGGSGIVSVTGVGSGAAGIVV